MSRWSGRRQRKRDKSPEELMYEAPVEKFREIDEAAYEIGVDLAGFTYRAVEFRVLMTGALNDDFDVIGLRVEPHLPPEAISFDEVADRYDRPFNSKNIERRKLTLDHEAQLLGSLATTAYLHPSLLPRFDTDLRLAGRVDDAFLTDAEAINTLGFALDQSVDDYLARIRAEQDGWSFMITDLVTNDKIMLPRIVENRST